MVDVSFYPHPHLTSNILYVCDAPPRVKWSHLAQTFKPCGTVKSLGATKTTGGHRTWSVRFTDIAHAETALATLHGEFVKGLPSGSTWPLSLSYSAYASMDDVLSNCWNLPQYVKGVKQQTLQDIGLFSLFCLFRAAGPLASMRFGVELGSGAPVCAVKYWRTEHAKMAETIVAEAINKKLHDKAKVTLTTYNPCSFVVCNIGPSFLTTDIVYYFRKFGVVVEQNLISAGQEDAALVITYAREEAAEQARTVMLGMILGTLPLAICYVEYIHEGDGARPEAKTPTADHTTKDNSPSGEPEEALPKAESNDEPCGPSEQETRAERLRRVREAEEAEQLTTKNAEDAERARFNATLKRMACSRAHRRARDGLDLANMALQRVEKLMAEVLARREKLLDERSERQAEVMEAEAQLNAAQQEEDTARADADAAKAEAASAQRRTAAAGAAPKFQKDHKDSNAQTTDEDKARDEEIAQSRRKMAEMYAEEKKQEEKARAEREAKAAKEAQERAEHARREKEQAEREAEEAKRKENAEKAAEKRRRQARQRAADRERDRCKARDEKLRSDEEMVGGYSDYHWYFAYERFKFVLDEFESLNFDEQRPLTFWNIPWPTLNPQALTPEDVNWEMVEEFCDAIRYLDEPADHLSLLQKAQRCFHPDKWRSRRVLLSVCDPDTMTVLEATGNAVAQALTPLWLKARKRAQDGLSEDEDDL